MRKPFNMAKNLLLDTGFWYALYDSRDPHHADAKDLADLLESYNLVLPWPILYETLNSRFVRRRQWLDSFYAYANGINTVRLSDETYRNDALGKVSRNPTPSLPISLVDQVIWLVLLDPNTKIDAIITFNPRDFQDICYSRNIELYPVLG
jgi:predicted nucleic acid-binding protein